MLKKIPLRLRLTLVSVGLLLACCLGLTLVLNFSANQMADVIEAMPVLPALSAEDAASAPADSFPAPAAVTPARPTKDARRDFLNQSVLWMLAVVAAGGVLTWLITGRAMAPLRELSGQMRNRTVHNLSENLPVPESRDEVASLTESFNEMTGKLDEAFAMQKRFSQSAAHELRTPLAVLKTKLEVFRKKKERTLSEYDALLDTAALQVDRLSALVKELLDLTGMDAVDCEESVPLAPLLRDVAAELSGLAEEKNVALHCACPNLTVPGSRSLLHRVFYNLIENSIKYNVPQGSVSVAAEQKSGSVQIAVSDTGLGIPPECRELIFEPFYRIDKSRSRQMGGAGLGLATVASIVQKHGGSVEVREHPEGGSIFTVKLPQ